MKSICVFCGSRNGDDPAYLQDAQELGRLLARQGLALIYGGAQIGIMGALADGALGAGGHVIGVIPRHLLRQEIAHENLGKLHIVESMHERKALMAKKADAFVALPGGFGTFEEFIEILTWSQLGLHNKPMGILNTAGFYSPLLSFFDQAVTSGFIPAEHRARVLHAETPADLIQKILAKRL